MLQARARRKEGIFQTPQRGDLRQPYREDYWL